MTTATALRVACAQLNTIVGDLAGNVERVLQAAQRAHAAGAHLLVCPEMTITGYPAEDWLLRESFCRDAQAALEQLQARLAQSAPGLAVVVGSVSPNPTAAGMQNTLLVLQDGQCRLRYAKHHLPEYGVFDETRVFVAGQSPGAVLEVAGVTVGFAVCEDLWFADTAQYLKKAGAQLVVSIHASPYERNKCAARHSSVIAHTAREGLPLIYVNLVGGQDELVFDGNSFVTDATGVVRWRMAGFEEDFVCVDDALWLGHTHEKPAPLADEIHALYQALVVAVRDYVQKSGFRDVTLGLSGGVDSALVAAIAVDALGKEHVHAIGMPSRFTSQLSLDLAEQLAANLGIDYVVRSIEPVFEAYGKLLAEDFAGKASDLTEENLQARIRGMILMAHSNKFGRLVLTTGNKSESAVGYSTLYGDTAGAFAPLRDVLKTDVWALCRYINRLAGCERIVEAIIDRAPSAELRAGQTDAQSLPEYAVLDAIIAQYVQEGKSVEQIVDSGIDAAVVERIVGLIHRNEYKRRQCPVGPKVSAVAFGRDWRFPMTCGYRPRRTGR